MSFTARTVTVLHRLRNAMATAAAALLEPMLILVMGAVVLGIVLAVLMPIIEINQLVR